MLTQGRWLVVEVPAFGLLRGARKGAVLPPRRKATDDDFSSEPPSPRLVFAAGLLALGSVPVPKAYARIPPCPPPPAAPRGPDPRRRAPGGGGGPLSISVTYIQSRWNIGTSWPCTRSNGIS